MSSDKWKKAVTAMVLERAGSPGRNRKRLGSTSSIDKAYNKALDDFETEQDMW